MMKGINEEKQVRADESARRLGFSDHRHLIWYCAKCALMSIGEIAGVLGVYSYSHVRNLCDFFGIDLSIDTWGTPVNMRMRNVFAKRLALAHHFGYHNLPYMICDMYDAGWSAYSIKLALNTGDACVENCLDKYKVKKRKPTKKRNRALSYYASTLMDNMKPIQKIPSIFIENTAAPVLAGFASIKPPSKQP